MTKKDFIALANHIREAGLQTIYTWPMVESLADFLGAQNPSFNRERWLAYVKGEYGPNGGRIRHVHPDALVRDDSEG